MKKSNGELHSTIILRPSGELNCTMTVYQGKKKKNVILLSTLHQEVSVGKEGKMKPETVTFYNSTKYGVDVVDQMARKYTTKAASRR